MPTKPSAADATIPHSESAAKTQRRRRISARRALFIAPPAKKMNANVQLTMPPTASMKSKVCARKTKLLCDYGHAEARVRRFARAFPWAALLHDDVAGACDGRGEHRYFPMIAADKARLALRLGGVA